MLKHLKKTWTDKNSRSRLLSDGRVLVIILLGLAGALFNFTTLLNRKKTSVPKIAYWPVKDTSRQVDGKHVLTMDTLLTVDTLRVIYHQPIYARIDSAQKERTRLRQKKSKDTIEIMPALVYNRFYFAYNSAFLVWIAFASIGLGVALAFIPVLFFSVSALVKRFKVKWWTMAFIIFFTALIAFIMAKTDASDYIAGTFTLCKQFSILLKDPDSLHLYVKAGVGVGFLGILGQMTVNSGIGNLPPSVAGLTDAAQLSIGNDFQFLRDQLKLFLVIDSSLVVLAVLTTGAFKQAILSEIKVDMDIMPPNFIYLYGIMFTFFLAAVYLPIYARLKAKGAQMLADVSFAEQEGRMKGITNILRVQQNSLETLKVALSILAPVLSSLVPGLLKF